MSVAIVTGCSGLIGSEATKFFHERGFDVVGVDNNMREYFFGRDGSVEWNTRSLAASLPRFAHKSADIRDADAMDKLFSRYGKDIGVVIHAAAQPSHDWAAKEPLTDFSVNATGTLILLEAVRKYCPDAPFIFTSTNKVYGDTPNFLPLTETESRWEVDESHPYFEHGIDESMSIDNSKHSVFGASKVAADVMTQEYGRYFGLKTGVFRGGCLTGPAHSGAMLHGFLAYLIKCVVSGKRYTIFGYKGKQVRDNIHSNDLVKAFWHFYKAPRSAAVYNMGGGRFANCSVLEAIELSEEFAGRHLSFSVSEQAREGDHIWWVSDTRRFQQDYPDWVQEYDLSATIGEIVDATTEKFKAESRQPVTVDYAAAAGTSINMRDLGKQNVLGVGVSAIDYEAATERIVAAARAKKAFTVSALAVHGVMTGALDPDHRHRLNKLDLVVPDGQPVRWAMNWIHKVDLRERVYGPELTLRVCERAAADGLSVFLYGSRTEVLTRLEKNLKKKFPALKIAGSMQSLFRQVTADEQSEIANTIKQSGASVVLVGLGCPRQETWIFEYRELLSMPLLAVGAAFDFHAETVRQAPEWMQKRGLEWLFRFSQEPRRLFKRYTVLNALYIFYVVLQYAKIRTPGLDEQMSPPPQMRFG